MHNYVSDPRTFYNEFRRVQNAAAKYGHPGPVWITELGAPDGGVYPWRVPRGRLAGHLMKAYVVSTAMGIEKLFWHCYLDAPLETRRNEPLNSEHFFGLVKPENKWKPAAHAYKLFADHCNNSVIRADLVQKTGGLAARQLRTALYRRPDGESALVLWFEPALRPAAHARLSIDLGPSANSSFIHDIDSGYKRPLVDPVIDITEEPLFITFSAPDAETPLKLAVEASPADASWLALLALVVLGAAALSLKTGPSPCV